jgi:hypothetical protein
VQSWLLIFSFCGRAFLVTSSAQHSFGTYCRRNVLPALGPNAIGSFGMNAMVCVLAMLDISRAAYAAGCQALRWLLLYLPLLLCA